MEKYEVVIYKDGVLSTSEGYGSDVDAAVARAEALAEAFADVVGGEAYTVKVLASGRRGRSSVAPGGYTRTVVAL